MTQPVEGPRSFSMFLQKLEDGQLLLDLSVRLFELCQRIAQIAKSTGSAQGELVLKIKILGQEDGKVQVDADFATKEPQPKRGRTWLWFSKAGNLVAENPKQQPLFPREVPAPTPVARDVPDVHEPPRGV
jgi:hypothetical protein